MLKPTIFREYDIRGVADTELASPDIVDLGRALGTLLQRKSGNRMAVTHFGSHIPAEPASSVEGLARNLKALLKDMGGSAKACVVSISSPEALIRIIEQPQHGKLTVANGTGFTSFPENNVRFECNKRKSEGVVVTYEPAPGYTGSDSLNIDTIHPSGSMSKRHYSIDVR